MTTPHAPSAPPTWLQHQECGSQFWLRVMRVLSLRLGRRLTRPILYGIALYFLAVMGKARRASADYLCQVHGRPANLVEIYQHFLAFASTIHDRVYLLNDRFEAFDLRIHGAETLHALHERGTGVFLFGGHVGSFEVIRAAARHRSGEPLRVCLAMYEDNARRINSILAAINPANTPEIIPLGKLDSMLAMHQCLDAGAVVGILADRSLASDDCLHVPLFERNARLPIGPFRLAALLRQPVVFMIGLYRGGNCYDIHFQQIADFSAPLAGERSAAVRQAIENYAATLESYCRSAPLNWFNFYDFWEDPPHA